MNLAQRLERWLEEKIEGLFRRGGKAAVQPVEIARRMVREMESKRRVSVDRTYVPNDYQVSLAPEDYDIIEAFSATLSEELGSHVRARAERQGYAIPGQPQIRFVPQPGLETGQFTVAAKFTSKPESPAPSTPEARPDDTVIFRSRRSDAAGPAPQEVKLPPDFSGFTLESTTGPESGRSFPLPLGEFTLGRDDVNRIVVADPNISRVHANIAVGTEAIEIADLNSRNGTYINGERITTGRLAVGDELRVGMSVLVLRGR